jgi:hypothetical protein
VSGFNPTNTDAGQAVTDRGGPCQEAGANGRKFEDQVKAAVDSVAAKPTRDPKTGQFVVGGVGGHAKTLAGSALLLEQLGPVKREIVARVVTDRGLDADAPETLAGVIDGYAEARLLRQAMWVRLIESGGPVTGKGKKRALFDAYCSALDRETKLAQVIGLDRRARPVVDGVEYLKNI